MNLPLQNTSISDQVFRPIQYLGSKLRSLDTIVQAVNNIQLDSRYILDLFAGTTVVSQALAINQNNVIANDSLAFCKEFGLALLGVGKPDIFDEIHEIEYIEQYFNSHNEINSLFEPWIKLEKEALETKDFQNLKVVSEKLPQLWRASNASSRILTFFHSLKESTFGPVKPVVSTIYAGTYFGITQAIEIDLIRSAIEQLSLEKKIDRWKRAALLTALLSSVSECVSSAGKHFAQPFIHEGKTNSLNMKKRFIADRTLEVFAIFREKIKTIKEVANKTSNNHFALHSTMESLIQLEKKLPDKKIGLIYADPPYTAQQYSRFYHIPETIVMNKIPNLLAQNGKPTRGLYPADRYKSRFCSKRQAPEAFRDLIRFAKLYGASLLISYSGSKSGFTGNERSIGLDSLIDTCKTFANPRDLKIIELNHEYRQLNKISSSIVERSDAEYLIFCNPND